MTDKDKIRNIIELFIAWNGETDVIDIANIDSAVDFISDSMQEKPKQCMYFKDNYTEEDRKVLCEGCEEKCEFNQVKESTKTQHVNETCKENGNSLTQEPVSEDLEEAVNDYIGFAPEVDECLSVHCERKAFESGAEWQKEQMMAKAIDGVVTFDYYGDDDKTYGCVAHDSFCLEDFGLKDRDKVKVIVIKED